jgi:hypothetical protein
MKSDFEISANEKNRICNCPDDPFDIAKEKEQQ